MYKMFATIVVVAFLFRFATSPLYLRGFLLKPPLPAETEVIAPTLTRQTVKLPLLYRASRRRTHRAIEPMPAPAAIRSEIPRAATSVRASQHGKICSGTAGVYELQLRRKLLQQQLGVVDERCRRVARIVAKKYLTKPPDRQDHDEGDAVEQKGQQPQSYFSDKPRRQGVRPNARSNCDHRGGRRRTNDGVEFGDFPSVQGQHKEANGYGEYIDAPKATGKVFEEDKRTSPPEILTAAPFRRGGCIDHTNKKHLLRDKQRALDRDAAIARRQQGPPKGPGVRDEVAATPSAFPDRYLRGEVPCSKHCSAGEKVITNAFSKNIRVVGRSATPDVPPTDNGQDDKGGCIRKPKVCVGGTNALVWVCPLEQLDYDYYLPLFFDGIRCLEEPCKMLARQGVCDLLDAARGAPHRILPSLPGIMRAIRVAISCKNPEVLVFACTALRALASGNKEVAEAMVKYYRMFLHVFNLFMNNTKSTGDMIDYGQRNSQDVGEAVSATLETLERHGGKHAFAYIKQCIPTCELFMCRGVWRLLGSKIGNSCRCCMGDTFLRRRSASVLTWAFLPILTSVANYYIMVYGSTAGYSSWRVAV